MLFMIYRTPCVNSPALLPSLLLLSLSHVLSQVSLPFDLGGLLYKAELVCMCVRVCVFKLQPWQLHKGRQSWNKGHVAIFQGQRGSLCIDQQWVCHKSVNLSPISSPGSRCTLSFHFPHLSLSLAPLFLPLSLPLFLSSSPSLHVSQLDLHKTGFLNPRQACEGDLLPALANIWSRAAWINTLLSIWTLASHQTGDDGPGKLAVDTSYQHLAMKSFRRPICCFTDDLWNCCNPPNLVSPGAQAATRLNYD